VLSSIAQSACRLPVELMVVNEWDHTGLEFSIPASIELPILRSLRGEAAPGIQGDSPLQDADGLVGKCWVL
jgi:hypothetical protein